MECTGQSPQNLLQDSAENSDAYISKYLWRGNCFPIIG